MSNTPDLERQAEFNPQYTSRLRTFTNDKDHTHFPVSNGHDSSETQNQNILVAEQNSISGFFPTCMQPTEGDHVLPRSVGCVEPSEGDGCSNYRGNREPYRDEDGTTIEKTCMPTRDTIDCGSHRTSEDASPAVSNEERTQATPPASRYSSPPITRYSSPPMSRFSRYSRYSRSALDHIGDPEPTWQREQEADYGHRFPASHLPKRLDSDILEPLQVAYKDDLVYNEGNALIVNLATIQRINLEILRDDLVRQAFEIKYLPPSPHTMGERNTEKIHEYGE
jgi:hypothetical protein